MAKKVVGLKLGASRLNAACVAVNGSAEVVQLAAPRCSARLITAGEVRDGGPRRGPQGLLRQAQAPSGASASAWRTTASASARSRSPESRIRSSSPTRFASAPRKPSRFRSTKRCSTSRSSGRCATDGTTSKRVLLVVAYRDLIAAYAEACRLAGIRLVGIDLEAFALLRALTPAFATEPGGGPERSALVAVSIGSERSVLGVSDGYSCEYARVLDWGGNSLADSVARALELDPPTPSA